MKNVLVFAATLAASTPSLCDALTLDGRAATFGISFGEVITIDGGNAINPSSEPVSIVVYNYDGVMEYKFQSNRLLTWFDDGVPGETIELESIALATEPVAEQVPFSASIMQLEYVALEDFRYFTWDVVVRAAFSFTTTYDVISPGDFRDLTFFSDVVELQASSFVNGEYPILPFI